MKPHSTSTCPWDNVNKILTINVKFLNRTVSLKYLIKNSSRLSFDLSNSRKYILLSFTTVYRRIFLYSFSASLATDDVIWLQSASF